MTPISYVFASCKEWHRPLYEELVSDMPGQWTWVSTPHELSEVITCKSPRYVFFLHWNWLVPRAIWEQHECVCFHMTDVPYGRGGSPLQNLIVAGHAVTKLTALRMVEEMDAGPVYIKRDLGLNGSAQDIYLRVGMLSVETIRWMIATEPTPSPQQGQAVVFRRRVPEQSRIPEDIDIDQLYDLIRMLDADGYPHAFIDYGNFRLQFRAVHSSGDQLTAQVIINKLSGEAENERGN